MKLAYYFTLSALSLLFISSEAFNFTAHADETATEKVENKAGDIKTAAKKTTRKAKRHIRKAAGTDTVGKDAKDKVNDVKDDVSNGVDKMKR
jgi:hypothetical protein